MEYEFMSLGGGCLALYLLGKDRMKGPVDNVLIKTYKAIEALLDNTYLERVKSGERTKKLKDESYKDRAKVPYMYDYAGDFIIMHNEIDDQYIAELGTRMARLDKFIKTIKAKNHYLIFSVPYSIIGHNTHDQIENRLTDILNLLKKRQLLDKTIFVWAIAKHGKEKAWYNVWPAKKTIDELKRKYDFIYIELTNIDLDTAAGIRYAQSQFREKVIKIIKPQRQHPLYLYF